LFTACAANARVPCCYAETSVPCAGDH
jgi:hypothetical protein